MSICKGVAGNRGRNPTGIFIHNDGGGQNANAAFYRNWLQHHNLESGFAHYYVADDGILQAEEDGYCAWHCGQTDGNTNYLSIEVCQSMGNLSIFEANEEKALALAAQKCIQYGLTPSHSTIRLHREVYATSCPHRSVEIHGGEAACKAYFIQRIHEIMAIKNKPITATANKVNERKEITMVCFYRITDLDKDKVYYFDGQKSHPLNHRDERKILNQIYKDNNGKDMPEYFWTKKEAPWFVRLKDAMSRTAPEFYVK